MAVGSDVGPFPHGTQAREFVLMVKYGMSPLAVLQADVLNGAKLLAWDGQIGALEPGYLADVIAVPGDPLQDIEVLQKVLLKGMSSKKHFSLPERQKYFPASSPPRHSADTSSLAA